VPHTGNLDRACSLARLVTQLATQCSARKGAGTHAITLVHLAPPPATGTRDPRTRSLLKQWARLYRGGVHASQQAAKMVYISTTGVYGDCAGARFDERRRVQPQNPRAARRVAAERLFMRFSKQHNASVTVLRVPGIYAENRLPIERLQRGTPALLPEQDVYTNHVHADDLARLIAHVLNNPRRLKRSTRIYHAVDDSQMKMGEYFDAVAHAFAHRPNVAPPPRVSREVLAAKVSPMMLSFMRESRRLTNHRIKRELRFRLQYPTVMDGLSNLN
jgi:nucleoside-diphosphate-sugar epimerase